MIVVRSELRKRGIASGDQRRTPTENGNTPIRSQRTTNEAVPVWVGQVDRIIEIVDERHPELLQQ
jgi:hypothetical protein